MSFIKMKFPFISSFMKVLIRNAQYILPNAYVYSDEHFAFLRYFLNLMNYIDLFFNVKTTLLFWYELH